ncbi:MAG: tripartite tricarboxylate transporter TctB family protein [Treponema sp.]|jgi:putative tricarboxylic transport membrane protein|nr:tripartite tricarboxylate transporter TctB family protein [Treponema sp.]
MTGKNMLRADFYTSLILMAFGIAALALALKMPVIQGDVYSAPGLLPALLGSVIFALSFIMFVRSLYRSKGKVGIRGRSVKAFVQDPATRRIFLTLAVCVFYAVLLGKIYFPALTFLFVFSFVVCFEYERGTPWRGRIKKIAIAALLALIVSALVTLTFERLFLVRLP